MTNERKKAEKLGIDITARKAFDVKEKSRLSEIKKDMEVKYNQLETQEKDEEAEVEYQKMLKKDSEPEISPRMAATSTSWGIGQVPPDDIFNVDETWLFWQLLPNKTLAFKGDKCTSGKKSKDRVMVLIGANMLGTEKIPLLVIGKSQNLRCFKNAIVPTAMSQPMDRGIIQNVT